MSTHLSKREGRQLKLRIRILDFCRKGRGFNEIDRLLTSLHVSSRSTTTAQLDELVRQGFLNRTIGGKGFSDRYLTTKLGEKELGIARLRLRGKYTDLIPLGEFRITVEPPPRSDMGGVLGDSALAALRLELDSTVGKDAANALMRASMDLVRGGLTNRNQTYNQIRYTDDGRSGLVALFSMEQSGMISRMYESGRFAKIGGLQAVAYFITLVGLKVVFDVYSQLERSNFSPGHAAMASPISMVLDGSGNLSGQLLELNSIELLRKVRDQINIQIAILRDKQTSRPDLRTE